MISTIHTVFFAQIKNEGAVLFTIMGSTSKEGTVKLEVHKACLVCAVL